VKYARLSLLQFSPYAREPFSAVGELLFGHAQSVFLYTPEKIQPVEERPIFVLHYPDRMPVQFSEQLLPLPSVTFHAIDHG